MRMKGANKPASRICEFTGRTLIDRVWYWEMVPPPIPEATSEYGDTPESIVSHAHYQVARDWHKPSGVDSIAITSESYRLAVAAGWVGHRGEWDDNVIAGKLKHGHVLELGNMPKKLKRRIVGLERRS